MRRDERVPAYFLVLGFCGLVFWSIRMSAARKAAHRYGVSVTEAYIWGWADERVAGRRAGDLANVWMAVSAGLAAIVGAVEFLSR